MSDPNWWDDRTMPNDDGPDWHRDADGVLWQVDPADGSADQVGGEVSETQAWNSRLVDGEVMISAASILEWLRSREKAWAHCRDDSPARVAAHLADELRDTWIEGTR